MLVYQRVYQIQMSFLKECQVIVLSNSTNLPEDLQFQPIQGVILLLFESHRPLELEMDEIFFLKWQRGISMAEKG